jgi:hypothetical protein
MATSIPADYICPISMSIMSNPYIHACGRSFDLENIKQSISYGTNTCPMCRQQIIIGQNLFPNLQLKNLIDEYNGINTHMPEIKYSKDSPNCELSEQLTPELDISSYTTGDYAVIKFDTKQQPQRRKLNLCFVVDKSGSMGTVITLKQEGREVSNGLTRLDLVKHTLKTIISMLGNEDIISLVTFSSNAEIIFENLEMTDINKKYSLDKIENYLVPADTTNIWDGLRLGLELMYKMRNVQSNSSILLLTDGCPNIDPPMGYKKALNSVYEKHNHFTNNSFVCNIHTFGYGNELDSKLLRQISDIGNGEFNFIPDASFVGTIFINALTNIMLTHTISTQIILNYEDHSIFTQECGSILYEQDRTIIIPTPKKLKSITINYQDYYSKKNNQVIVKPTYIEFEKVYSDYMRLQLVNIINQSLESQNFSKLTEFIENIKYNYQYKQTDYISDLLKDAEGEIQMALSPQYYNTWGQHYLRSISKAHECQLRNNFKDPGVQHYCNTEIYNKQREQLNDIFNNLPAPKPSARAYVSTYQQISMTQLNDPQGGCISGDSLVVVLRNMSDIVTIRLEQLKVNDLIAVNTSPYRFARVTHIVVTQGSSMKPFKMSCLLGGLKITPWHPVFVENRWVFPQELVDQGYGVNVYYHGDVYNLVLDNPSVNNRIMSAKYPCITLGHNILDDPFASHEYLGTNKIIEDLDKIKKNIDGKIYIESENFIRDMETGLICGIKI